MNAEELDDKIDKWHLSDQDVPLHEYLGMTWEEYCEFVLKGMPYESRS